MPVRRRPVHSFWRRHGIEVAILIFCCCLWIMYICVHEPQLKTSVMNSLGWTPTELRSSVPPISHYARYDINGYIKAKFDNSCYVPNTDDLSQRVLVDKKTLKTRGCSQQLPQAILTGVRKCGLGRILQFLRFHPNVEMRSELVPLELFSGSYDKGLELYRKQMPYTTEKQLTIERTPEYFVIPHDVPKRIHDEISPRIKIIAVICDPVKRAISEYVQAKARGGESDQQSKVGKTFEETVIEQERQGNVNHLNTIIDSSLYFKHFLRWLQYFPQEQFHLIDSRELIDRPASALQKLEDFLGLPRYFASEHFGDANEKKTGQQCLVFPENICVKPKKNKKRRKRPEVDEDTKQKLYQFFAPYDRSLSDMFKKPFSWSENYGENQGLMKEAPAK
ncbi:heparan sulfate glucosamine 3-O-sulfotransferase 5-like [Saccoglossus kowalevskii]|uniref:Heparan sulfate glucosamine 3-O-sulfotransferase 4-like n=1 Tax=Saccoglossus kowalevskii TaxID=10224 RepID=A0ABM0MK18_SACKO|nr:PREDICTED: heparan sulfate glucosamine 3-O-sulfotransferase 4-like [Saccoglossus kowalevskii]